jgi:SHS2 domain-containing protein
VQSVAIDADGSYTELATGHGFAFELEAPSLEACLARAVEAFAESVADVHPSRTTESHPIEIAGATPSALLLGVLEECLRCAREGDVAVGLRGGEVADGVLRGVVETVAAGGSGSRGTVPHVLSWHEVGIDDDPASGTWRGRVVAR